MKPGCMWSLIIGCIVFFVMVMIAGISANNNENKIKAIEKQIELEHKKQMQALETPEMIGLRDFKKRYIDNIFKNFNELSRKYPDSVFIDNLPIELRKCIFFNEKSFETLFFFTDVVVMSEHGIIDDEMPALKYKKNNKFALDNDYIDYGLEIVNIDDKYENISVKIYSNLLGKSQSSNYPIHEFTRLKQTE